MPVLAKWCVINTQLAVNRDDKSDASGITGGRGGVAERERGLWSVQAGQMLGRVCEKSRPFRKFSLALVVQCVRNIGFYLLK